MRVDNIFSFHEFRNHITHVSPFLFKFSSSFWSSSINTKNKALFLIGMSERVEILFGIIQMTSMSYPSWMRDFVIEESWWSSFSPLFKSEPFNWIGFHSFSIELHWSALWIKICHSVIPSLSGISIKFPTVSLISSCPIWHFESFEESSWSSIESNISNSFKKCFRMEVLSIDMELNVWFFMELLEIEVFNSNTYIILN